MILDLIYLGFLTIFFHFAVSETYKLLYYLRLFIKLDVSELDNILKTHNNRIVFAGFGHTCYYDILLCFKVVVKFKNITVLAKKKYEFLYPKFLKNILNLLKKIQPILNQKKI